MPAIEEWKLWYLQKQERQLQRQLARAHVLGDFTAETMLRARIDAHRERGHISAISAGEDSQGMPTIRRPASGGVAVEALALFAAGVATAGPSIVPTVGPAAPIATPNPAATPRPAMTSDVDDGPMQPLTSVMETRTDADGDREYVVNGVEISVGPP